MTTTSVRGWMWVAMACAMALSGMAGRAQAQGPEGAAPPAEETGAEDGAAGEGAAGEGAGEGQGPGEGPGEAAADEPDELPTRATIRHLPLATVGAGEGATFRFVVRHPDLSGRLVVRHRALGGEGPVGELSVGYSADGLAARLEAVPYPGLEYWVVEQVPGGERAVFASEEDPHPVTVLEGELARYERERLERFGGRRSRAVLRGEYVHLGARAVVVEGGERRELSESYYQLEASYVHSFFTFVDSIRLSLGRMRGNVVNIDDLSDGNHRGLDYGGAEVLWRAHDIVRFRTGILFGFSQEGFEIGALLDAVVGDPEGTSLTLGVEAVTTLGAAGRVRLGWLTVPRVPMGATVEVTTWPAGDSAGVRLLYDVGYEIYPGAYARIEGGYRGWTSTTGGPSLGAELALAF